MGKKISYEGKAKEKELEKKLLQELQAEVSIADSYWEHNFKKKWDMNSKYVAGDQYEKLAGYDDQIVTNYVLRNNEAVFPELINKNIDITVEPRRSQFFEASKRVRGAMYYIWEDEEFGVYDRCEEAVKDMVDISMGVVKTTYLFEDEEITTEKKVPEDRPFIKQAKQLAGMVNGKKAEKTIKEKTQYVLEDRILVETISPFDIRVSFGCDGRNGTNSIPLIAQEREFRKDQFTRMVGKENLDKYTAVPMKNTDKSKKVFTNKDGSKIEVYRGWEIWMKDKYVENGYVVCIVDEDFKAFIKRPTSSQYLFGHPFHFIRSRSEQGEFYPRGRTWYYKDNQDEYNMQTSFLMSFTKKALPKFGYDEDFISPRDADKIANGEELSLIGFSDLQGASLKDVFQQITSAQIPREVLMARDASRVHIDEIPGVTNTFAGGGVDKQDKATLGVLQDRGSSRRIEPLKDKVDAFIGKVMNNVFLLMQEFLDKEIVIGIEGDEGVRMESITKKQLVGDYAMTVRTRRAEDVQDVVNILTLLKGVPEAVQPNPITGESISLVKIAKVLIDQSRILRKIPGIIMIAGDADNENMRMLKGEKIKPRMGEDHMLHAAKHTKALQKAEQDKVDPQVLSIIESHLEETMTLIEEENTTQMKEMIGGGSASSGSGQVQPIAPKGVASEASPAGMGNTAGIPTAQTTQTV